MRYFSSSVHSLIKMQESGDSAYLLGVAGGRVSYAPGAKYLYSVRVFLLIVKFEILWTTQEWN